MVGTVQIVSQVSATTYGILTSSGECSEIEGREEAGDRQTEHDHPEAPSLLGWSWRSSWAGSAFVDHGLRRVCVLEGSRLHVIDCSGCGVRGEAKAGQRVQHLYRREGRALGEGVCCIISRRRHSEHLVSPDSIASGCSSDRL